MSVRDYRKEKRMTQKELAEKSGVTQSNISRIENKDCRPSIKTAQALAKALDCTIDDLLREPEETAF